MALISKYQRVVRIFFQACDQNRSGFIEPEDLETLCQSLSLDSQSILEIFGQLDTNGDGVISFEEFTLGFTSVQEFLCPDDPLGEESQFGEATELECRKGSEGIVRRSSIRSAKARRQSYLKSAESEDGRSSENYNFSESFEDDIALLSDSCQDRIADLGLKLKDLPPDTDASTQHQFEVIVFGLVSQLKQMDKEVYQLSDSLRKASTKHSEHISHLQDEMEAHLSRAERTAYTLAEQAATSKQKETERRLEAEIMNLKDTLDNFKRFEDKVNRERKTNELNSNMKRQIDTLSQENHTLKTSVIEAQSGIAMLRAEMAKMHRKFEEQQMVIAQEKEAAKNYQDEVLTLSKQLQAMHETNKRLHDTSDVLNFALERNQSAIKMLSRSASPTTSSHARSNMSDDSIQAEIRNASRRSSIQSALLAKQMCSGLGQSKNLEAMLVANRGIDYYDESDSGRYSMTGSNSGGGVMAGEIYEEDYCGPRDEENISDIIRPEDSISMVNSQSSRSKVSPYPDAQTEEEEVMVLESDEPQVPLRTLPSLQLELQQASENRQATSEICDIPPKKALYPRTPTQDSKTTVDGGFTRRIIPLNDHKVTARCDSNDTLNSEMSQETVILNQQYSAAAMNMNPDQMLFSPTSDMGYATERSTPSPVYFNKSQQQQMLRMSLEPKKNVEYKQERMYRVVLAGDAAVGKSSFILQLCTGYFHNRITSTLGVDFHTKAFDIDGKLTNLQLWDTAGQERFRAMAKSYFRRADGAILLYDVTFEQSFLHVRDWVETIESGANRKIPILICANKCDAVAECVEKRIPFVSREEGQALANSYDATFVEVSAKEGDNVLDAVVELSRLLWIAEDEERVNGLKLTNEKEEEESKCCK